MQRSVRQWEFNKRMKEGMASALLEQRACTGAWQGGKLKK